MKNSYSPSLASSRRRFLKKTLAGVSLSTVVTSLPAHASLRSLNSDENSEMYWEQVRQQFGLRPGLILMNAANLCPSPRAVSETVSSGMQDLDFDASFHNRKKFSDLRTELRQKLASYLNVEIGEITLTRNTSESNNTIVQGLPLKEGDEVVLWDQNHPTNLLAWQ
ncbi:MAG: aminotransferase class V-fold PLP-dependent enzyme, partial [Bacteroidota bacterium]